MNTAPKMEKYLHKARVAALQGSIRKPYFQDLGRHLAVETYAGSGGSTECVSRGFAVGKDISYKVARTKIDASEQDGIYHTTLMAQVEGLRIGERITVDKVTCRLHSIFDSREYPNRCLPRILPAGSTIKNLRIDGKIQKLDLPRAFEENERTHVPFFLGKRDDDSALQPGPIPDPIYVPGLGTIFYAEWTWVHRDERHQQRLTMLRFALGSDFGAGIDTAYGSSDGTGWPPTQSL